MRRFRPRVFSKFGRLFRVVATLALFAVVAYLAAILDPSPSDNDLTGQAIAVDGDTLRISGERIRLLGLDAPELDQVCRRRNGAKWDCGIAAKRRLAKLIDGQIVECLSDRRDKYRRFLAYCTVGDRDIGAIMVGDGLAIGSDDYQVEQFAARARNIGLWAGTFDTPRAWRDREQSGETSDGILQWLRRVFDKF